MRLVTSGANRVEGKVVHTFINGNHVYDNGQFSETRHGQEARIQSASLKRV